MAPREMSFSNIDHSTILAGSIACQSQPTERKEGRALSDVQIVWFLDSKSAGLIAGIDTLIIPFRPRNAAAIPKDRAFPF